MASSGRVIVITGGSGGIGAEVARRLAGAGHHLVLAARRPDALHAVAAACGPDTVSVVADVTRRADVERLRDEALRAHGHVDVWMNNAGRGITRPVLALTDDDVDAMIDVNVKSVLYGIQAIVPHFMARGAGHLINVSSFLGRVPLAPHRSVYSAAKAMVNSLTSNLRTDLRATHPGIVVSLVMPGMVLTDFAANAIGGPARPPAGAPPGGGMAPQSVEEVGAMIADLVAHPVAELYTNPASEAVLRRYHADVAGFDAPAPVPAG